MPALAVRDSDSTLDIPQQTKRKYAGTRVRNRSSAPAGIPIYPWFSSPFSHHMRDRYPSPTVQAYLLSHLIRSAVRRVRLRPH